MSFVARNLTTLPGPTAMLFAHVFQSVKVSLVQVPPPMLASTLAIMLALWTATSTHHRLVCDLGTNVALNPLPVVFHCIQRNVSLRACWPKWFVARNTTALPA